MQRSDALGVLARCSRAGVLAAFLPGLLLVASPPAYGGLPCSLTCPADQSANSAAGLCAATVNYPTPTTSGSCGTVTCTPPSGGQFPVGSTTVTCADSGAVQQTATYSSGNLALPIPDVSTVSVPLNIPDTGTIVDVDVRVRLNHPFDGDLVMTLTHPDATVVPLATNRGGSGDNYGSDSNDCAGTATVFDDEAVTAISGGIAPFAGSFRPESPLSVLDGKPVNGAWSVTFSDTVALDIGTVFCVSVVITRLSAANCTFAVDVSDVEAPVLTCPANQTAAPGPFNYPPPTVTDNCPDPTASCVPPPGSSFPSGTTPVTCNGSDESANPAAPCTFTITGQQSVIEIPTLSPWSLLGLLVLLGGIGVLLLRRWSAGGR